MAILPRSSSNVQKKLNNPDLNINALYEFECDMSKALSFQKEDFLTKFYS